MRDLAVERILANADQQQAADTEVRMVKGREQETSTRKLRGDGWCNVAEPERDAGQCSRREGSGRTEVCELTDAPR